MPVVDVRNIPTVVEFAPEHKVVEFTEEAVTAEVVVGPTVVEFSWGELVPGPGLRGGGVFEGTVHIDQDIPSLPNNSEPIDPEADYLMLYDASSNLHVKVLAQLGAGGIAEIPWATREETDAGVLTDKALNPDVGAYAYDRFRHAGQHAAGKGTQTVMLTPTAGVVTVDGLLSNVFYLTLEDDITEFANPVNPINGQTINIHLKQDVVGGRVVESWGSQWKFTNRINPILSTDPNAVDLLSCQWNETDSIMECSLLPDFGSGYTPPPVVDIGDLTGTNLGGGNEVYKERVLNDLKFRTIIGGGDIDVTTVDDTIVVSFTMPAVESVQYLGDLIDVLSTEPEVGASLIWNGEAWAPGGTRRWTLGATWTNGPNALVVPVNDVNSVISEKCAIVGWYLLTDGGSGSCVVDILRVPVYEFPPLTSDTICGGNKPTVSSSYMASDTDLIDWSVDCEQGDLLQFQLNSTSTFNTVQLVLVLEKRA